MGVSIKNHHMTCLGNNAFVAAVDASTMQIIQKKDLGLD
jgi:hypothetical protein